MSVGTIVTIVLLMTTLILGLVLVRTIFKGSTENINSIDQAVKNEVNKLFAEDNARKIVIYPPTKLVVIQKGNADPLGFALSIRNLDISAGVFTYTVSVNDPQLRTKCNIDEADVNKWIQAGSLTTVTIPPGDSMEPEFIRFIIPQNAPPCLIRFGIDVKRDGAQYGTTVNVDLQIKSA